MGDGFEADVIPCDLMMPTMLGSDFYRELSKYCPGQERKVVFMPGGAFGRSVRTFLDEVRPQLFDKPIDLPAFRRFLDGL